MKWILSVVLVLSFSTVAFAKKGSGKRFQERKAKMIEHIGKRINVLNTAKSCISSAADRDAMKACRKSQKASMQALKEERKAWKAQRKANRKK